MIVKGTVDENFPIASVFLPARARGGVVAFYAFARIADDIADATGLDASDKLEVLALMREQLQSGEELPCQPVHTLSKSLARTGVTSRHALDLLKAFERDALNASTANWAELMAYCRLSAAPVGRYVIDLMGGVDGGYGPSDALSAALQVLNHIQDAKNDYLGLSRIYVPGDWMTEAGVMAEDLGADVCSPAMRDVFGRMLDGVGDLLDEAAPLPGKVRSKALAREVGGILAIAKGLTKMLRRNDPLARRVKMSRLHKAFTFVWGALRV